jgi:hypothetical protein
VIHNRQSKPQIAERESEEEEKAVTKGRYTRDFYFLPTILLHNGECYVSVELAWLKWYIGIVLAEDF